MPEVEFERKDDPAHLQATLREFREALRQVEESVDKRMAIMDRVINSPELQAYLAGERTAFEELLKQCV